VMMSDTIKVLSYNIHKGFNQFNNRYLLEQIRRVVRAVDADLVFLQEVVGRNVKHLRNIDDWMPESQFEYLADSVWPFHAYGKNAIYSHGHHGNAVLSKAPFVLLNNVDVTQFFISQRGVLVGKTRSGIYVFCVHLGLFSWERDRQLKIIVDEVNELVDEGSPLILAGDFNDWNMRSHKILVDELALAEAYLVKQGGLARTYPVWAPLLCMDRVYCRNLEVVDAVCFSGKPWSRLSDHCALYAELSLSNRGG